MLLVNLLHSMSNHTLTISVNQKTNPKSFQWTFQSKVYNRFKSLCRLCMEKLQLVNLVIKFKGQFLVINIMLYS